MLQSLHSELRWRRWGNRMRFWNFRSGSQKLHPLTDRYWSLVNAVRERSWQQLACTICRNDGNDLLWLSIVPHCRHLLWKQSFSVMKKALSSGPSSAARHVLKRRIKAGIILNFPYTSIQYIWSNSLLWRTPKLGRADTQFFKILFIVGFVSHRILWFSQNFCTFHIKL